MLLLTTMTLGAQQEVCSTGYIMDWFCINRGTLLDNGNVITLEGPEQHSVHCLVDPSICWRSGFALLELSGGSPTYCSAYSLDEKGNDLALALARAEGDPSHGCTTCTGGGTLHKGFQATVIGTVDPESPAPRAITVSRVLSSSVSCTDAGVSDGTLTLSNALAGCAAYGQTTSSGSEGSQQGSSAPSSSAPTNTLYSWTLAHGSLMLISWGFVLPLGVIIAKFLRHRDPLWFKLHRALQLSGLALALAGFIIALSNFNVFEPSYPAKNLAHGTMGVIIMTIGLLQPINAFFRPHKDKNAVRQTGARRAWEMLHKGGGYLALMLTVPTLAIGSTLIMPGDARAFQIALGCGYLALIFVAGACIYSRGQPNTKQSTSGVYEREPPHETNHA